MDRAEICVDSDAIPGVSISVVVRRPREGQSTSSRSTSSGVLPRRSNSNRPSVRVTGSWRGAPERGIRVTRGLVASRYQVTIRVHSPASVGAICSPTRALSNVDLPALTFPATATRSGSSSRSIWSRSWVAAAGLSR